MASFRDEILDAVRQGLCITTSTAQLTAGLGSRFFSSLGQRGAGQTSQQAANLWGNAASQFCNRVPEAIPPEVPPQFTGGQCSGGTYNITYTIDLFNPFSGNTTALGVNTNHFGPLGAIRAIAGLNGTELPAAAFPGGPQVTVQDQTYQPGFQVSNIRNVSVTRTDGPPDNCGDMPGTIPGYDPNDYTYPTTLDFDDDGGNPQSIGVDIVYKPTTLSPDNNFNVPFEVNFPGGSQLFGDLNISGNTINIGPGNSSGDGNGVEPVELQPEEPPEEGTAVVGVRVSSTVVNLSTANVTEIFFSGASITGYYPRLATVYFLFDSDQGPRLGDPQNVNLLNEVVIPERPAIGVEVLPRDGVTVTWSLLVRPENQSCCG